MAVAKISDLPAASTPTGSELFEIVQSSVNSKLTLTQLATAPTAKVGLSTVNGTSPLFMRADAAPQLDVGIIPTWTGAHTFNKIVTIAAPSSGNALLVNGAVNSTILSVVATDSISHGIRITDGGTNSTTLTLSTTNTSVSIVTSNGATSNLNLTASGSIIFNPGASTQFSIDASGAWNLASSSPTAGTSGQVLASNGAGTPPTWQQAPSAVSSNNITGGGTNQIPFQSATSTTTFNSNFVWNSSTQTLSIGSTATNGIIQPLSAATAITLTLAGGQATSGAGGAITLQGGAGTSNGNGGSTNVKGGIGGSGGGDGGNVNIAGGTNGSTSNNGGAVNIQGGTGGSSGTAGNVILVGGTGGTAGNVSIQTGGNTRITFGSNGAWSLAGSTGTSGQVLASTGGSTAPNWATLNNTSASASTFTVAGVNGQTFVNVSTITIQPSTGTLNATILNTSSDINKKKNIKIITNGLEIINSLNGVTFDWIDNNLASVGLIAQDVEKVLPQLVSTNAGTGAKSLNYNGIIGVLVEAVKDLTIQIDILKNKLGIE